MPAYVISDVTIRDADAIESYRSRAAASIARYGGRYLARGGAVETLEGTWRPNPIIIVEFRTGRRRGPGIARRNMPRLCISGMPRSAAI